MMEKNVEMWHFRKEHGYAIILRLQYFVPWKYILTLVQDSLCEQKHIS